MSNFVKRTITGIFLVIFLLSAILINDYIRLFAIMLFSNIAIYELSKALNKMNYKADLLLTYIFNNLFLLLRFKFNFEVLFVVLSMYIMFQFLNLVLSENPNFNTLLANIFVSMYITLPYTFLVSLDKEWTLFAFAVTAFTDTFAYLIGMLFGKHKLIERLSPKKTVEGAIGGVFGALLLSFIFIRVFNIENRLLIYIATIFISIVSQISDLFASYIKREANIKDYGNILIGHGGIMDRFDSILLVAPLVYLLVYNLR